MQRAYPNRVTVYLLIYLFYLGCLTLAPFDFTTDRIAESTWVSGSRSISDTVLNVIGFMPFGLLLYFSFLPRPIVQRMVGRWAITAGAAAALSLSIEAGQLFLRTRVSSPADLLTNTVGAGLGFWMAHHLHHGPWIARLRRHQRGLTLLGLTTYLGSLTGLFIWTALPQHLDGWDARFPFLVGNEATLDRPWLGKIFFLALYDRVLTPKEIASQFQAGLRPEPESHEEGRPITLYLFREVGETRIRDYAPVGPPLDLEIVEPRKVTWLPTGGLQLISPTLLRSGEPPEKVYRRFTTTSTFTVVAWIEPRDPLQTGPARIVSFSLNPSLRNFTLGQEGPEIHFRVRNPVAGPNGTRWDLRTKGLGLKREPIHLVAIYDRGTEHLYANGVLVQKTMIRGSLALLARLLDFDTTSPWQRGLLLMLLLGPVTGCCLALRRDGEAG